MNEKKRTIIETSIKLFAEKGFHATSIQEIAEKSNVSKGAFYLYFDSKEALMLSIFEYFFQQVQDKIVYINSKDIEPREKLTQQIAYFFDLLSEHKEYIIMLSRDNLQLGDNLDHFILEFNKHQYQWLVDILMSIFGDRLKPYIVDAAIQLDGMMQGYFKWIVLHQIQIDCNQLARFIVKRLDNCIQGMLSDHEKPQVTIDHLKYGLSSNNSKTSLCNQVQVLLNEMLAILEQLPIESVKKEELQQAADVIVQEINKKDPKKIVVQGMLTPFQAIPDLKDHCRRVAELCDITLLLEN